MLHYVLGMPYNLFLACWFAVGGLYWLGAAGFRWRYFRRLGLSIPSGDALFLVSICLGAVGVLMAACIVLDDRFPLLFHRLGFV